MHPEVQSDKPGSCPKCGMDLVPKATSAAAPKQPAMTHSRKDQAAGDAHAAHQSMEPGMTAGSGYQNQ